MSETNNHTDTARDLGRKAFEQGLTCPPSQDPVMDQFLAGLGALERIDARGAYQSGWLQASLAAPDPKEAGGEELDESCHDGSDWRRCWHGYRKGECPTCNPGPGAYPGERSH